jgi:hypothetical protein
MGSLNEETGYRYQPESELRRWIGWPLGAPACLLPLLARTHTHGSSACQLRSLRGHFNKSNLL